MRLYFVGLSVFHVTVPPAFGFLRRRMNPRELPDLVNGVDWGRSINEWPCVVEREGPVLKLKSAQISSPSHQRARDRRHRAFWAGRSFIERPPKASARVYFAPNSIFPCAARHWCGSSIRSLYEPAVELSPQYASIANEDQQGPVQGDPK